MPRRRLLGDFFRSPIALTGGVIAGLSVVLIVTLMIVETLIGESNPYLGLVTFLILPMAMFFGFVLIIIGMRRQKRVSAELAESVAPRLDYPILDFNNRKIRLRNTSAAFCFGFAFLRCAFFVRHAGQLQQLSTEEG